MKQMLNLQQTSEILANPAKLNAKQLQLITRLHKENLARAGYLSNKTCDLFANVPSGDIRYNQAIGKKYEKIRPGINKAATTQIPAKNIDPNTGEYVDFNKLQKDIMHKAIKNGQSRTQAVLLARKSYEI